jgi:hypothetical protein
VTGRSCCSGSRSGCAAQNSSRSPSRTSPPPRTGSGSVSPAQRPTRPAAARNCWSCMPSRLARVQYGLDTATITTGPIFRRVTRTGAVSAPLSGQSVALIIKKRARAAGGLHPHEFAGHSLRSGYATQAARDGHHPTQIAATTRHQDQRVLAGYIQAGAETTPRTSSDGPCQRSMRELPPPSDRTSASGRRATRTSGATPRDRNGRVGGAHRCAPPPSEPDVHLSMHPAQAAPGAFGDLDARRSAHHRRAGRPRVHAPRPWSQRLVCPLVGASSSSSVSGVHLTTSALFRARAPGPVSGRLSMPISRRGLIGSAWFPAAFRRPAFASWSSCSRSGVELSLRSAYRLTFARRTSDGVFRVSHARAAIGVGALSTPGTTVLTLTGVAHRPAPVASQRRVPTPRHYHHRCEAPHHEASTKGSSDFTRPIFPSPVAPGWRRAPLGSSPELRTPPSRTTHVGTGTGHRART